MKYTLLSIKPKYVIEIKNGEKIYEFRKKIPDFSSNDISKKVLIYCSKPVKSIIGEFTVEKIISLPFDLLMEEIKASDSYKERLKNYFGEATICYALKISEFKEYRKDITLDYLKKEIKGFSAPQNYRFLKDISNYY